MNFGPMNRGMGKDKSVTEEPAILIGNDHGGFELKSQIVEHLANKGLAVHDV